MLQKVFIVAVFASLCVPVSIAEEAWSCPDAEAGQEDFYDGTMQKWPNYSEAAGSRVQHQHTNSAFVAAQAKYIDWGDRTAGLCQYYNHIGLVTSSMVMDAKRVDTVATCTELPCPSGPYWRYEFVESTPEQDKPGQEQMLVCMEDREGLAYPSAGCGFISPE